jgi:hypothetical protein
MPMPPAIQVCVWLGSDIYFYAAKGWQQVKGYQTKHFGGPTTASSDPYFLNGLLGDSRTRDAVNFATWHSYLGDTELDGNVPAWKAAAAAAGKPDLPLVRRSIATRRCRRPWPVGVRGLRDSTPGVPVARRRPARCFASSSQARRTRC